MAKQKKEGATRLNEGKPRFGLLHLKSLEPIVRVLEWGAEQYGDFNWMKGESLKDLEDHILRHMRDINDNEMYDKQTNQLHMAHVGANVMFWLYNYAQQNKEKNNE